MQLGHDSFTHRAELFRGDTSSMAVGSSDAREISPIAHVGSVALFTIVTIVVVFGGKVVHRSYTAETIR